MLKQDVKVNEKALHDFFIDKNVIVTHIEFDALIIHRYLNGTLGDDIYDLLVAKNRNRSDWWYKLLETMDETSVFSEGVENEKKENAKSIF